jgi:ankyrin repeat protein
MRHMPSRTFATIAETWTTHAAQIIEDCLEEGRPGGPPPSAFLFRDAWLATSAISHGGFGQLVEDHPRTVVARCRDALVAIGAPEVAPIIDEALAAADLDRATKRSLWDRHDALVPRPEERVIDFLLARTEPWYEAAAARWLDRNSVPSLHPDIALQNALTHRHPALLRRALAAGADVNQRIIDERTPLHDAVGGHPIRPALVAILLDAGADPVARDHRGMQPIHLAPSLEILDLLLACGASASATTDNGRSVFHHVASLAYTDAIPAMVRRLLASGADPSIRDQRGMTPLHYACAEAVAPLIEAGAELEARDRHGRTPLMTVHKVETVAALLARGARVDARDHRGRGPLHRCRTGSAQLLVDAGASLDVRDADGMTPLVYARADYVRAQGDPEGLEDRHGEDDATPAWIEELAKARSPLRS